MIIINSRQQFFEIGLERFLDLRKKAENRSTLHHFSCMQSIKSILSERSLKCVCLKNPRRKGYFEKDGIDGKHLGTVFISCLTSVENDEELWRVFGCDATGARITFSFNKPFHNSVFDKSKRIQAFSSKDLLLAEYDFRIDCVTHSTYNNAARIQSNITVDLFISDAFYRDDPINSTLVIEGEKCLNLTRVCRRVLEKYTKQDETRVIGLLKSVNETEMHDIAYLLVPLDFSSFDFNIAYGCNATSDDIAEVMRLENVVRQQIHEHKTS